MFANGHKLIMDLALDAYPHPALHGRYDAMLLGNLREDVYKFPFMRRFMLGKGLTHYYKPGRRGGAFFFVPSAPTRSDFLFLRAVRLFREGKRDDAAYNLGRVAHLLSEMAAPVHAQMVLHWRGDPFEMYLETRVNELRPMKSLPPIPQGKRSAGELVHELAVFCQAYPCDRTRNLAGYVGWRLGLIPRHDAAIVDEQVRVLVPQGAAYTVALYRLFIEAVGESPEL